MIFRVRCSTRAQRVGQLVGEVSLGRRLLGAAAALIIAGLGFGTDWRPYGMLAVWLAIGLGWYALRGTKQEG